MSSRRFGKNMSGHEKNAEERIVENEEAQIDVASPFPPQYVHTKTEDTMPTVDRKPKWWHSLGFFRQMIEVPTGVRKWWYKETHSTSYLRQVIEAAPGVSFITFVAITLVAVVMLIIMRKMEYINIIFTFMIGIFGLGFISAGLAVIVKREITTGFSEDEPNKTYVGKEAVNIGQFLIGWGILILIVGYILLWLGSFGV